MLLVEYRLKMKLQNLDELFTNSFGHAPFMSDRLQTEPECLRLNHTDLNRLNHLKIWKNIIMNRLW